MNCQIGEVEEKKSSVFLSHRLFWEPVCSQFILIMFLNLVNLSGQLFPLPVDSLIWVWIFISGNKMVNLPMLHSLIHFVGNIAVHVYDIFMHFFRRMTLNWVFGYYPKPKKIWWYISVFKLLHNIFPVYQCIHLGCFQRVVLCTLLSCFSWFWLFVTLGTVAHCGILQARTLELVAMPSPRGSSWPRDGTRIS